MASNAYEPPAGFDRLAKLISFSLSGCLSLSETVQVTIDDLNIEGSVIWAVQLQAVEAIPVVPVWLMSLMAGLLSVLGVRQLRVNRK